MVLLFFLSRYTYFHREECIVGISSLEIHIPIFRRLCMSHVYKSDPFSEMLVVNDPL